MHTCEKMKLCTQSMRSRHMPYTAKMIGKRGSKTKIVLHQCRSVIRMEFEHCSLEVSSKLGQLFWHAPNTFSNWPETYSQFAEYTHTHTVLFIEHQIILVFGWIRLRVVFFKLIKLIFNSSEWKELLIFSSLIGGVVQKKKKKDAAEINVLVK